MSFTIKEEGRFKFIEEGHGETIIVLHGLFGGYGNFDAIVRHFSASYTVAIPKFPLYELEVAETTVEGMVKYIEEFIDYRNYKAVHLLGNSLGGHVAQIYALQHPEKVSSLILTASSGLFENSLGDTYPRKSDYDYVRKKAEDTFYNPAFATKELVDEVYAVVNDRARALRMVVLAKSALRHNLRQLIPELKMPVCLIWGKNDTVTPAFVGEEYLKLLPQAELHLFDKCGHAPMMEHPEDFNRIMEQFLQKHKTVK